LKKMAAVQMCSSADVDENLQQASKWIAEAAENKASLVVLPEMFAIMGMNANDKILIREARGEGKIQSFLARMAREHRIWIVGGTIPLISKQENKVMAASLVYDDHGKLVAHYDKMHLFDVVLSSEEQYRESDTITAGNKIVTVDSPVGKLGLAVCYDVRFPELFRCLSDEGVEVIALPSAFTVPTGKAHWEILVRARAIENFCYVIAAAQGGNHVNGRKTWGHSMIVAPWGNVLAVLDDDKPGIIYAEMQNEKINEARQSIPVKQHRRILTDRRNLDHEN